MQILAIMPLKSNIIMYGLKGSFEVGSDGHIWAYALSKASKHDIKMVEDLLRQYRCQYILADQGYLSNE